MEEEEEGKKEKVGGFPSLNSYNGEEVATLGMSTPRASITSPFTHANSSYS